MASGWRAAGSKGVGASVPRRIDRIDRHVKQLGGQYAKQPGDQRIDGIGVLLGGVSWLLITFQSLWASAVPVGFPKEMELW